MNHGVLLVDKPLGITSHDVVATLRRTLKRKDIGHAGTLDPDASGLMVVLLGDATKLSDILLNGDKGYTLGVRFGAQTDTGDLSGKIIQTGPLPVSEAVMVEAAQLLIGTFEWEVPIYSAVKVQGKKLYEYARENVEVLRPKKNMTFSQVSVVSTSPEELKVDIQCSKGSFMRVWAEKLGEALGSCAAASSIRRTLSTPYKLESAMKLADITAETAFADSHWIPLEKTLQHWPQIRLEGVEEKLISNGQIPHKMVRYLEIEYAQHPGVKALSRRTGRLIALLAPKSPFGYSIQRVFPSASNPH
jgi:tRNA pseudouridine55 synthase